MKPKAQPALHSRWPIIPALLLVVLTLAAFARTLANGFTDWDDQLTLHHNPQFNPPTAEGVLWYWQHPAADLFVPVTYTVWGLLAGIAYSAEPGAGGIHLDPAIFHAASVLTHCAAAMVVYLILRLMVHRPWAAFAGAALFAVHPVQVEAVAWASGLKDLLAGLFSFLALWQYLLFATAGNSAYPAWRFKDRRAHFGLALIFLMLAMLSKPSAMVTPILALVLDRLVIRRPLRRVIPPVIVMALIVLPVAIEARLVQTSIGTLPTPILQRPLVMADALAFYLYKLLLPIHLSVDYGRRPAVTLAHGWLYWTWIFPALAALLLWRLRTGRAWLWSAALIFTASLLPVLGLVRFTFQYYSTVADHYLYLAMLGPALALTGFFSSPRPRWTAALCGMALALLAILSINQARYWADDRTLWSHVAAVSPDSFLAHTNLGANLRLNHPDDPAALNAAIAQFQEALTLNPQFSGGHAALAQALLQRNAPGDRQSALSHLLEQARLEEKLGMPMDDQRLTARISLGRSLLEMNRRSEAAEVFGDVLNAQPDDEPAREGYRAATAAPKRGD